MGFENIGSFREVKFLQGCSKVVPRWFLFPVLLKEPRMQGQSNITSCYFCWCKSGELGGSSSLRFPCVTPVVESFSSDLLWVIIIYWAESHLESCQNHDEAPICKIANNLNTLTIFAKKGPTTDVWLDSKCTSNWRCCKCGMWVDCMGSSLKKLSLGLMDFGH